MPGRGIFIAFEGGEGVGKSTQIRRLHDALTETGCLVTLTREPGGSAIGQRIRKMTLGPETGDINPRTEALLFAADRAEHVATVIRPALTAGNVVLTDRYMDSSAAYQGAGRGLSRSEVIDLSLWATDNLVPDMTFVLDLDPNVGLNRATTTEFGQADRFESETATFARTVRAGFLALAEENPERYRVLDATRTPESLAEEILDVVSGLLATQTAA